MKKSLVMASLLALGISAMAIDVQPYVGAGLGASWNKVHISEYSDRNAGVQPDTFAMRFSRV